MKKVILLCMGTLILLAGCTPRAEEAAPETQAPPDLTIAMPDQEAQQEEDGVEQLALTDTDGELLLTVRMQVPDLTGYLENKAAGRVRTYYDNLYAKERTWWTGDLLEFAREDRRSTQGYNGAFTPYEITGTYEITRHDDAFLSVRRHVVSYTGGARGSETVVGDTFRVQDGEAVTLDMLFADDAWEPALLELVRAQITERQATGQVEYYENAMELAEDTFDPTAFYLTDAPALVLIYGSYTLAPYSAGIQEFSIPFTELPALAAA